MRRLTLACALLALARPHAAAQGPWLDERAVIGLSGQYFGNRVEAGAPFAQGLYALSVRVRSVRYRDAFLKTSVEYSAGLRRELFHVSLAGRIGTKPPNAERAAYHVARGEALFTIYGTRLGPEHPELSPRVWESSGPAPAPEAFDRTWVTRLRGRFTTTNHHLELSAGNFILVQNSWQFELRETWRERTSLGLHMGFDRYNKELLGNAPTIHLDNVEYAGGAFALRGWPNNHAGADAWVRLGQAWRLSGGVTRLNLLNNQLELMYGGELEWRPWPRWSHNLGYWRRRRRGTEGREALSLGVSYAW